MLKNKLLHFPPKKEYEYAIHCLAKLMLLLADIQYYFESPGSYDAQAPEWFIQQIKDNFHGLPDAGAEITEKLKEYQLLKENLQRMHTALEQAAIDTNNLREQLVEREKNVLELIRVLNNVLNCPSCLGYGINLQFIGVDGDVDFEIYRVCGGGRDKCNCRLAAEELLKKVAYLKNHR